MDATCGDACFCWSNPTPLSGGWTSEPWFFDFDAFTTSRVDIGPSYPSGGSQWSVYRLRVRRPSALRPRSRCTAPHATSLSMCLLIFSVFVTPSAPAIQSRPGYTTSSLWFLNRLSIAYTRHACASCDSSIHAGTCPYWIFPRPDTTTISSPPYVELCVVDIHPPLGVI